VGSDAQNAKGPQREGEGREVDLTGDRSPALAGSKVAGSGNVPDKTIEMPVEYVDATSAMVAALAALEERVSWAEEMVSAVERSQARIASAARKRAEELRAFVSALDRRIDRIHEPVVGVMAAAEEAMISPGPSDTEKLQEGIPARFAGDPDHQSAWRMARMLIAGLEASHSDRIKEGILQGSFRELLGEQLAETRRNYEREVPERIREQFDYYSAALDALIARRMAELARKSS